MSVPETFLRKNLPWLLAGFLLTFSSSFGQTYFIAIFAGDIRGEFGLSNAGWGGIYAAATIASAMVMVFAGGVADRYKMRLIAPVIMVCLAIACVLMSRVSSVLALALIVFLLRLMGQGMMIQTSMVATSRWFVASRGRAISIVIMGVALGEAMLPVVFVALKASFDWRSLWMIASAILLLAAVVIVLLLKTERMPQSISQEGATLGMAGQSWTRVQVLRHWMFWLTLPALLGPSAWNTAFFFHQVHFAEAKGWAHLDLVARFPLFTATAVGFMLATGWLIDRIGTTRIAGLFLLPAALGYVLIGLAETLGAASLALIFMGMSVGANMTMGVALWAEVYGTANLGRIRAMTGAISAVGTALGPAICGWLIDRGIDLPQQAFGISAYFVVAAILAAIGGRLAARLL